MENILTCTVLQKQFKSEEIANRAIVLTDIYSQDINTQKQVTELFKNLMKMRENIVINNPAQIAGPCIDLQRPSTLSD